MKNRSKVRHRTFLLRSLTLNLGGIKQIKVDVLQILCGLAALKSLTLRAELVGRLPAGLLGRFRDPGGRISNPGDKRLDVV